MEGPLLHKTRNLVEDWREGDARKLATLEMEADVGWPGGGGWQTTAEEQERKIRESNLLGAIVTENEERIISLCTIRATPGQKAQAFIPHLNCHPDYHGKKHGKSALWGAMERAYETGYQRVDLYTWPGNLQAVPLYKKMGFMWRPDSSVHMENFTPAARRHPLAAAFFARHDWYETQVRELKPEEDVMTRGRVKVYEYLWRAPDGDLLRLVFDRQSWGIIELENNDLTVSCSLPDEKLVSGVPHAVRWRIVNKKPHPARVFLAASGDPGIKVEKREAMDVADATEIEGTFVIDPNIEEKSREPKAAVLRTDLVIDGVGIRTRGGDRCTPGRGCFGRCPPLHPDAGQAGGSHADPAFQPGRGVYCETPGHARGRRGCQRRRAGGGARSEGRGRADGAGNGPAGRACCD